MCEIMKWIVLFLLGICAIRDWRKGEIPTLWLILVSVLVVLFLLIFERNMFLSRVVGGLLGVFFFFISRATKEAVGYADSWWILVLGVYLGSFQALQVLFVATVIATVVSLFYLWRKRWRKTVQIPFIPYIAIAYLGVVCL